MTNPSMTKVERGSAIYKELVSVASRSQLDLQAALKVRRLRCVSFKSFVSKKKGVDFVSIWIINTMYVKNVDEDTVMELLQRDDVQFVRR